MKTALALLLGSLAAIPAYGTDFVVSDGKASALPEPPARSAADCISHQNAVVNSDLGIPGLFGPQGACLPGNPGTTRQPDRVLVPLVNVPRWFREDHARALQPRRSG